MEEFFKLLVESVKEIGLVPTITLFVVFAFVYYFGIILRGALEQNRDLLELVRDLGIKKSRNLKKLQKENKKLKKKNKGQQGKKGNEKKNSILPLFLISQFFVSSSVAIAYNVATIFSVYAILLRSSFSYSKIRKEIKHNYFEAVTGTLKISKFERFNLYNFDPRFILLPGTNIINLFSEIKTTLAESSMKGVRFQIIPTIEEGNVSSIEIRPVIDLNSNDIPANIKVVNGKYFVIHPPEDQPEGLNSGGYYEINDVIIQFTFIYDKEYKIDNQALYLKILNIEKNKKNYFRLHSEINFSNIHETKGTSEEEVLKSEKNLIFGAQLDNSKYTKFQILEVSESEIQLKYQYQPNGTDTFPSYE